MVKGEKSRSADCSKEEAEESLAVLKTAEDFDRETVIIRLENVTLKCKAEDLKEEILTSHETVRGLKEKLKKKLKAVKNAI